MANPASDELVAVEIADLRDEVTSLQAKLDEAAKAYTSLFSAFLAAQSEREAEKARADKAELSARPVFVRCGRDLAINRNEVASVEWDRRHYMNGSSSWLVITMNTGKQHRIESTYGYYDSVDCSKIEKEIIGA